MDLEDMRLIQRRIDSLAPCTECQLCQECPMPMKLQYIEHGHCPLRIEKEEE